MRFFCWFLTLVNVSPKNPNEPNQQITDQKDQQKHPVDVQQPLVEPQGPVAPDGLDEPALDQQRRVRVEQRRVVELDVRHEAEPVVGADDDGVDEDDGDGGEEDDVAGVDPEAVVAHCFVDEHITRRRRAAARGSSSSSTLMVSLFVKSERAGISIWLLLLVFFFSDTSFPLSAAGE